MSDAEEKMDTLFAVQKALLREVVALKKATEKTRRLDPEVEHSVVLDENKEYMFYIHGAWKRVTVLSHVRGNEYEVQFPEGSKLMDTTYITYKLNNKRRRQRANLS